MESVVASAPQAGARKLPKPGLLVLLFVMSVALGFDVGSGALAANWNKLKQRAATHRPLWKFSQLHRDKVLSRPPQEQAERLMQAALNHDEGAIDLINSNLDHWRGQLKPTDMWSDLDLAARNSDDLRVRAAAIEIDLISFNLAKDEATADILHAAGESNPAVRASNAYALGMLANRGVKPQQIRIWLLEWAKDRDENTRTWAVEGLAQIGSPETVNDLVGVFRSNASLQVRERAACNLARTGMLTREQRMNAVPQLLEIADDGSQDASTRGWAFQALRQITRERLPDQGASWRDWYARSGQASLQRVRAAAPWALAGGR
jgi:HEAT repeat protein